MRTRWRRFWDEFSKWVCGAWVLAAAFTFVLWLVSHLFPVVQVLEPKGFLPIFADFTLAGVCIGVIMGAAASASVEKPE